MYNIGWIVDDEISVSWVRTLTGQMVPNLNLRSQVSHQKLPTQHISIS